METNFIAPNSKQIELNNLLMIKYFIGFNWVNIKNYQGLSWVWPLCLCASQGIPAFFKRNIGDTLLDIKSGGIFWDTTPMARKQTKSK